MPSWSDILEELNEEEGQGEKRSRSSLDTVRRKYLKELSDRTRRNTIAYYSGWLTKPDLWQTGIGDEDINGFMEVVHGLERSKGLDLLLHTPGGDLAATQAIIHYLRGMFDKDIRAIVPQLAMSGGTMIACACKEIVMGEHSSLGPIDPQIRGIPAGGVVEEFERAYQETKKHPEKAYLWQQIISQYRPTFIGQCEKAIEWSEEIVREQLCEVMFEGKKNNKAKAGRIAKKLNDHSKNKSHNRHIHISELKKIGLNVTRLEDDDGLQDLVLTVHHAYMHTLTKGLPVKIVENQKGDALIRNIAPSYGKMMP